MTDRNSTFVTIEACPEAPHRARVAVAEVLGRPHEGLDAAVLATSEIVSNAVQHGSLSPGDPIFLEIESGEGRVRVAVTHPEAAFDRPPRTRHRHGGWGLRIVESLATDWAISHDGEAVRVWFEVSPSA